MGSQKYEYDQSGTLVDIYWCHASGGGRRTQTLKAAPYQVWRTDSRGSEENHTWLPS